MEERVMPFATFRCEICMRQQSARLLGYGRDADGHEISWPQPGCHGKPMRLIQLDHATRAA